MPRRLIAFATACSLTVAAPAVAQQSVPYARALAAGYIATFTCSGVFNANRTVDQVIRDELTPPNSSPEVQKIVPTLKAEVDRQKKLVRVRFDDKMPPRIAAWRPHLGCSQLPIGATEDAVRLLPRLKAKAPANMDHLPWPMGDRNATAAPKGNRDALEKAVAKAFSTEKDTIHTAGVVVVQNGKIVAERYRADMTMHTPMRTWSAAKSIASTLVGIGAHKGLIDVMKPAPIPEWQRPGDPRAKITTDDLLRMTSGLYVLNNSSEAIYNGGYSVVEQTTAQPLETAPGTRFQYSNSDTMLSVRGLSAVLGDGDRALNFPFVELYWKLGMMHTFAETDWRGHYVASSQIWTTARDLARFGMLYLNNGVWRGERILPASWRAYVSKAGPAQPTGNSGYGGQFWLTKPAQGLPADTFFANGGRGNYAVIVPSRNVVIVRRGYDRPTGFDITGFAKEVLEALD